MKTINRQRALLISLALIFLSPALFNLITLDYSASWDESIQMYAAKKLVGGEGLTNTKLGSDLSKIEDEYLTLWPPGHSLLVSLPMKLGASLNTSAKIIKILFLLLSCILWSLVTEKFIRSTVLQVSFLAVVAKFSFLFLLYYSTDFFVFSIFPSLILIVHSLETNLLKRVLLMGVLTSLLITLKYTALVIPIIFSAYLIKQFYQERKKLLKTVTLYASLPVLTYATIFLINKINTHQGNLINPEIPQKALINNLGSLPYCLFQFINPLIIKTVPGANSIITKLHIPDLVVFLGVIFIITIAYLKSRGSNELNIRSFFLVSLLSSFVFFLALSLIMYYEVGGKDWWPLIELRYFSYLIPIFLLFLISFIEVKTHVRWGIPVFSILMIGGSLIYIAKNINAERFYIKNYANILKDINVILNSEKLSKNNAVILSYEYFPQLKLKYSTPVIAVEATDVPEFIEGTNISSEISIYLIYSKTEINSTDAKLRNLIEKYKLSNISYNNIQCYAGKILKN